jgi:hypothetical protein
MSVKTGPQAGTIHTYVGGLTGNGTVSNSSISGLNMDVATTHTGAGIAYVGGIAGYTTAGGIQNASITGGLEMNINAQKVTGATYVGGITGYTIANGSISNANITGGAKVNITTTSATTGAVYAGGIAGQTLANGSISNADITGGVEVTVNPASTTTSGAVYAGGIAGQTGSNGNVSNTGITGGVKVTVNPAATTTTGAVYAGGIAGQTGSNGNVSNAGITGGAKVTVETSSTGARAVYAGGIAGQTGSTSKISRGSITGPSEIKVESAATGTIWAGGLVGSGIGVEYSFIGTKNEHAKVNVKKTNTGTTTNLAYIGGISGQAAPTAVLPFQYNYAFCDVTLETNAGTTASYGQLAGGLAGYVSANQPFTESFAAGSVSIADNNSAGTANRKIQAGGIAGYGAAAITKCAALNGPVVINHSNSSGISAVYWRRIAYTAANADTPINATANNITTVSNTAPDNYTPSNGKTYQDGLLVTEPLTKGTFFGTSDGQLGWNEAFWEWDDVSGYPVLK